MTDKMLKELGELATVRTLKTYDEVEANDILVSRNFRKEKLVFQVCNNYNDKIHPKKYFIIHPTYIDSKILFEQLSGKPFAMWYYNNVVVNKKSSILLEILKSYMIRIPSLNFSQGSPFENIIFLTPLLKKDISNLYKYCPLYRFIENIKHGTLTFVSPETWLDPLETKYWYADYEKINFERPEIYCMCLTNKGNENEEAAWKMYSEGYRTKSVRINYNVDSFFSVLNQYAKEKNVKFYVGKVNYDYSRSQIENLYKEGEKDHDVFFPNEFKLENFLQLMCLKRQAFRFENEIRVFLVDENRQSTKTKMIKNIHGVDYKTNLLKNVKLSPYQPFSYDDPLKGLYTKLQKGEAEAIKVQLKEFIPGLKFQVCHLYDPDDKILKV